MSDPVRILFGEYWNIVKDVSQKGISLKDRFMYLFGPPGWSHDGSRKTSSFYESNIYYIIMALIYIPLPLIIYDFLLC